MIRTTVVMALLASLAAAAPAPQKDSAKKATDDLQGKWEGVHISEGGKEDTTNVTKAVLVFKGNAFSLTYILAGGAGHITHEGTFELDVSKRPKSVKMEIREVKTVFEGSTTAKRIAPAKLLGIFEARGKSLKWCVSNVGAAKRPKAFATIDDVQFLFDLEYVKP